MVDRAQKIHYWSGRGRSTSGAGADNPPGGAGADNRLVERAQKIHLVNQILIGLYNKGL